MFYKIGALKNFTKFNGKPLPLGAFFNTVGALSPGTLFKKVTPVQVFSYEFCERSKSTICYRTAMGDLLDVIHISNHSQIFYKIGALKNFTKPMGKHLCQSIIFNKVAGLQFSCEFCEKSKNTIFIGTIFLQFR